MNDVMMQQAAGAIRTLLGVGSGFLIGKGWVNAETATMVIGAVMTLFPIAWSILEKKQSEAKTQAREVVAVNAGIAAAAAGVVTVPTPPPAPAPTAAELIKTYGPKDGLAPLATADPPAAAPAASKLPFGVAPKP